MAILFKHRNYGLLSICFGCAFLVGLIFTYFLFDIILKTAIADIMNLRIGCKERRYYQNVPFPLTVKVYMFHILNKDEVQNGGKPHLQEIGPFAFDEFHWKINVIDDLEEDTMEFDYMKKYVFRPDLSNNLTGEEVITTLHPVLVSIGMMVHFELPQFMHVAVAAINELFHEPKDVFWTGKAIDLLFNGIEIDCNVTNPLTKIACREIRKRKDSYFKRLDNNKYLFSMFGGLNDTSNGRWKIYRGVKNIHDAGQTIEFDGQTEMTAWPGEECNRIIGTDGILFPPFIKKDEPLSFFNKQICASVHLTYKRRASYRGINLHVFAEDFSEKNISCFCRQPNHCPLAGTMDILPCAQAPITVSLPHFLHADPTLLSNIASGLNPNEEEHEFTMAVELNSGVDMIPTARVQVNFELEPVEGIEVMSKLPKMIFPFLWFETTANIPDFMANYLKYTVAIGVTFHSFAKWMTMTVGLFGTVICSILFILKRFTNFNIIEEETAFIRSSNAPKIISVAVASETDKKIALKALGKANEIENSMNGVANANAMILLSEVVESATKAANKNPKWKNSNYS